MKKRPELVKLEISTPHGLVPCIVKAVGANGETKKAGHERISKWLRENEFTEVTREALDLLGCDPDFTPLAPDRLWKPHTAQAHANALSDEHDAKARKAYERQHGARLFGSKERATPVAKYPLLDGISQFTTIEAKNTSEKWWHLAPGKRESIKDRVNGEKRSLTRDDKQRFDVEMDLGGWQP